MNMSIPIQKRIPVIQGDCFVTDDPNVLYTTVLGSCIAVCMFDLRAKVGGMNHFLLPGLTGPISDDMRYGVNSMELLINGVLKLGADRSNLQCKIFGGSEMRKTFNNIGVNNQKFTKDFLAAEGFPCVAENLGGTLARKLQFLPCEGRVRHMLIPASESPGEDMATKGVAGNKSSIELF
ncbi:MAG: chemotaxis protein CheD [Ascidiaceihabitans sp.]|jgi:chemotaxis protein CheD